MTLHSRRKERCDRHHHDRPQGAIQLARRRDRPRPAQGRALARSRRRSSRRHPARHPERLLQRRGSEVHTRGGGRERPRIPQARLPCRLRASERSGTGRHGSPGGLQTDPRIHPRDHLRDPPGAEAVHRLGRRHRGRRRLRPRDVVRSGHRQRAGHVRMGVLEDRPDGRRELDILPSAPPRLPPRDGAAASSTRASMRKRRSTTASSRESCRSRASTRRCLRLRSRLASGPTEALGIAKNLINDAATMDRLDYHLDRELEQPRAHRRRRELRRRDRCVFWEERTCVWSEMSRSSSVIRHPS